MISCLLFCALVAFTPADNTTPEWFPWVVGTWVQQKPNGKQRLEVWTLQNNQKLTGKGLKVSGGDTTLLENIEISISNDQIYYVPTVPDQNQGNPVSFSLVSTEGYKITFENPAHDFPQRIIYECKPLINDSFSVSSGDSLLVRVESLSGDGIDFRFRRQ